jgi:protein-tyrosine-phosphatase
MSARALFLCTGNSARSQLAEAIGRHLAKGRLEFLSAGTHPKPDVHPLVFESLAEMGIDASGLVPKPVEQFAGERFDYVIALCNRALESCPAFPANATVAWTFGDPAALEPERQREAFANVALGLLLRIPVLLEYHERFGASKDLKPHVESVSSVLLAIAKQQATGRAHYHGTSED